MSCSDERRGLNQKRGMRKTERGRRWRRQKQGVRRLKSTAVDFKILKCFQGNKKTARLSGGEVRHPSRQIPLPE